MGGHKLTASLIYRLWFERVFIGLFHLYFLYLERITRELNFKRKFGVRLFCVST